MKYRLANTDDYEFLLPLFRELDDFHSDIDPCRVQRHEAASRSKAEFERYIAGDDAELFLCAKGGSILGFANAVFHTIEEDRFRVGRSFVLLDNLFVAPASRRMGIGLGLYQKVKEWAAIKGTSNIEIQVFWGNKLAKSFYENLGFRPVSLRMGSSA